MADKCKATVFDRELRHGHACTNKAVTMAGFCGVHDPKLQEQRAAKRLPTKMIRQMKAREITCEFLQARLSDADYRKATRGIAWGWFEWSSPPWPIPEDLEVTDNEEHRG